MLVDGYICMTPKRGVFGGQHSMKSNKPIRVRLLVFILTVIIVGGSSFFWWQDAISSVDEKDSTPIDFSIESGEGIRSITNRLFSDGVIRSPTGFFILVKVMGKEKDLQAGDFRLTKAMTGAQIIERLMHGTQDVWITVPEGWRIEEIATEVAQSLDIPESEFLSIAQEGYMFPDTYRVPVDATAGAVIATFEQNFTKKVFQSIREFSNGNVNLVDTIILASLVEREGKTDSDRPIIAGILKNRLDIGMPLQVDATLQYALGYQSKEKSWWKKELTDQDKKVDSPYNTYMNIGLPPGPISNPGLSAIRAVINPQKTDYLYYLHDANGGAHYAKTLDEHTRNIQKYIL